MYTNDPNINARVKKTKLDDQNRMGNYTQEYNMEDMRKKMIASLEAEIECASGGDAGDQEWAEFAQLKLTSHGDKGFKKFCEHGNNCKSQCCMFLHSGWTVGSPDCRNSKWREDILRALDGTFPAGAEKNGKKPPHNKRVPVVPPSLVANSGGMGQMPALGVGWAPQLVERKYTTGEVLTETTMELSKEHKAHVDTKEKFEALKVEFESLKVAMQTLEKQKDDAFQKAMVAKDDQIEGLTTALTTAQAKRLADVINMKDRWVAARKTIKQLQAKPAVYVEVVKEVYVEVEKTVEAPVDSTPVVDSLYDSWDRLLSQVPKLIKSENVREKFATLARGCMQVADWKAARDYQTKKARKLIVVTTFARFTLGVVKAQRAGVLETLKERFAIKKAKAEKAEAAAKLQAAMRAMRGFLTHRVPAKAKADSDVDNMSLRTHGRKEVERDAARFPGNATWTYALLNGTEQTAIARIEQLITEVSLLRQEVASLRPLREEVATLRASVDALERERMPDMVDTSSDEEEEEEESV